MLRTGSRIAFTLVEVLVAVMILSFGMVGIIRGYLTIISGIDASRFITEASYLLKDKIADFEIAVVENSSVPSDASSGKFDGEYANFRWEEEAQTVTTSPTASTEAEGLPKSIKKSLCRIRLSVLGGNNPASSRKMSLYTYIGYFPEVTR